MSKQAIILADLLFGDCGKGTVTDYLTNLYKSKLVIRYNGGAQCAHNVYVNDKNFCFKQLSSGSIAGASTLLLDTVIINPITLIHEISAFRDIFGFTPKVYIHENALVTTPTHIYANRIKESKNNHGSCGMGIWETAKYAMNFSNAIRVKNLGDPDILNQIIDVADGIYHSSLEDGCVPDDWDDAFAEDNFTERCILAEIYEWFSKNMIIVNDEKCKELVDNSKTIIFEGAQGVLLDKDRGFIPYVSATDTTCALAEDFLNRIAYDGKIIKVGIIRSYLTRHGNGPLSNEVEGIKLVGEDNQYNDFQGAFRVGQMDIALVKHALNICPVDELFITCLDNDPFDNTTMPLYKALVLAKNIGKKLYGYSYGKHRTDKRRVLNHN